MPFSIKARNGAVAGATPMIMEMVPVMFHQYITEASVLRVTDAALNGAAEADPILADASAQETLAVPKA